MWTNWLDSNYSAKSTPSIDTLEDTLLSIGGSKVVTRHVVEDISLARLLDSGEQIEYTSIKDKWKHNDVTRSNECHFNSSAVWAWHQDNGHEQVELVYGFGLSSDGTWREHSFCYDPSSKTIHETTVDREVYFGVRLDFEEAKAFANGEGVFLQNN